MQTDRLISMQKCGIQVTKCRRKTDCLTKRGTKVLLFCQVRKKTGNKGNRLLRKGNFLTCLGQKSGTKVRKSAKKWVFSGGGNRSVQVVQGRSRLHPKLRKLRKLRNHVGPCRAKITAYRHKKNRNLRNLRNLAEFCSRFGDPSKRVWRG